MRKNKLFFMIMGLLVMGTSMVGCSQSDMKKEKQNTIEVSTNNIQKETEKTETDSQKSTFSLEGITYKITGTDTVAVKKLINKYSETVLEIPKEVTYNQKTYTVTSIEMKNLGQNYPSVEKIIVPKTVTEKMIISRRYLSSYVKIHDLDGGTSAVCDEDKEYYGLEEEFQPNYKNELHSSIEFGNIVEDLDCNFIGDRRECEIEYIQTFPNLTTISFLGETPPKKIQIEQYVTQHNLCYTVPTGTKESYENATAEIVLHLIKGWSRETEWWKFKSVPLMPDVIEENVKNPEQKIFATDTGVYLVKESAKNGKGKVALLHLNNLTTTYDKEIGIEGTLESEIKNGNYQYELTELESGAIRLEPLKKDSLVVLTLPNTITKLQDSCLDSKIPYLFLPKKCMAKEGIFQDMGDMYGPDGTFFCYATGLQKLNFWLYHPVAICSKEVEKESEEAYGENLTFVDKVETGAEILAPETVTIKEGDTSKQLNATFAANTNETLCYMMLQTSEMYEDGICNLEEKINVSEEGTITAKKAGTYYCMVYSQESGNHKIVKIIVSN